VEKEGNDALYNEVHLPYCLSLHALLPEVVVPVCFHIFVPVHPKDLAHWPYALRFCPVDSTLSELAQGGFMWVLDAFFKLLDAFFKASPCAVGVTTILPND
jgi:hypothetical protein